MASTSQPLRCGSSRTAATTAIQRIHGHHRLNNTTSSSGIISGSSSSDGSLGRIQSAVSSATAATLLLSSSSSSEAADLLPPHSGPFYTASCLIKPGKHPPPNVKARLEDQPLMTRTPDERRRVGVSGTRGRGQDSETWIYKQGEPGKTEFTQYRKGMYIHIR
jgi:hypothetical protein